MALQSSVSSSRSDRAELTARYHAIRSTSLGLCETLEPEDYVVQSMPSVSPAKWHLAHTSWFFEQFILTERLAGYRVFHRDFEYLFNSYYHSKGSMHPRARRGLLSRPTVAEVRAYRRHVDEAIDCLMDQNPDPELSFLVELGLNHEQQHQELMLTDIKHVFSVNPLQPALVNAPESTNSGALPPLDYHDFHGGIVEIGADDGTGFVFDNETPRHRCVLRDYGLANRLITNAEYREFILDGGYQESRLWLADGWNWLQQTGTNRPLYWSEDLQHEFTLSGLRSIDDRAPACHVSLYEADAFARWAGTRLPTEAEWEYAAATRPVSGHFADSGIFHPRASADTGPLTQIFGEVWEWTTSPYSPYPGFRPLPGSLGEYNGKFMCNQMVCRGGSCATPAGHVRASYRNFFYPHERWQFFGIRLARD